MDWSAQIARFEPLTRDRTAAFASPRDVEQAIGSYNKALSNLDHDSQDIALIALRKLVATYPAFAQPFFLYACCLAERGSGSPEMWLGLIEQAIQIGLPEDLQQDALYCQFDLQETLKRQAAVLTGAPAGQGGTSSPAARASAKKKTRVNVPAASVLERTGHSGKVKMASEKERQDVIRRGEFPQDEETHIVDRSEPAELIRKALPIVAGVLIVATLVLAAVRWLPKTRLFAGNREPSASERLDWLLERLEPLAGDEPTIADLLAEYRTKYQPTLAPGETNSMTNGSTTAASTTAADSGETTLPAETTAMTEASTEASSTATEASSTTTVQTTKATTTATPTMTPVPTADQAATALLDAWDAYTEAKNIQSEDVLAAAEKLLAARSLLAEIPATTTAEGLDRDAGSLSSLVENRIDDLANSASKGFRLLAEAEFANEQYEAALVPYLKAWQIKPDAYGGGVAYYCGRCYQLLGDYAAARPFYEYVVDTFAGRDIARSAAGRLAEMEP